MRNDTRDIHYYDIAVHASKQDAIPATIEEILDSIDTLCSLNKDIYPINNDTQFLTIKDIEINKSGRYAILLIAHADPSTPNAVYTNPESGKTRIIEKERGEFGEYGAHVVISLDDTEKLPNNYTTIIERVPSVSRALIQRLLNGILNNQYKSGPYVSQSPDKSGRRTRDGASLMVNYRPILNFVGHLSQSFVSDINAGRLSGITLLEQSPQTQIGGRPYLLTEERTLKVSVNKKYFTKNLWTDLTTALSNTSKDWSRARINFKNGDGRPRSITIDTQSGSVLDEQFVRMERI